MNCTNLFTCAEYINIVGYELKGIGWFLITCAISFWLQIAANFLWLKNSQISREIMQLDSNSCKRPGLVGWSVLWTAVSTLVWVTRIILVIGNNVYIFITILLGNVTGTYWASTIAKKDRHTLLSDMEALLDSEDHSKDVNAVLSKMYLRMQKIESQKIESQKIESQKIESQKIVFE